MQTDGQVEGCGLGLSSSGCGEVLPWSIVQQLREDGGGGGKEEEEEEGEEGEGEEEEEEEGEGEEEWFKSRVAAGFSKDM